MKHYAINDIVRGFNIVCRKDSSGYCCALHDTTELQELFSRITAFVVRLHDPGRCVSSTRTLWYHQPLDDTWRPGGVLATCLCAPVHLSAQLRNVAGKVVNGGVEQIVHSTGWNKEASRLLPIQHANWKHHFRTLQRDFLKALHLRQYGCSRSCKQCQLDLASDARTPGTVRPRRASPTVFKTLSPPRKVMRLGGIVYKVGTAPSCSGGSSETLALRITGPWSSHRRPALPLSRESRQTTPPETVKDKLFKQNVLFTIFLEYLLLEYMFNTHYLPKSNWAHDHNVCSVVVTPLESRRATSCGYNSSHPVWHALYECLQDIHGDSSPFLLQPFHELSNGFWPRLTSLHPPIQFVPKIFYRVEVEALDGPVQSANIVVGASLYTSFTIPRKVVSYSAPTETAPRRVSFRPSPPEQTRDRDSHESARATRRRRARTQLTSLSNGLPWHPTTTRRLHLSLDYSVKIYYLRLLAAYIRSLDYSVKSTTLDYSPLTLANRVTYPARTALDFRMWELCRTMPLVGGFSRGSLVSPAPSFQRCSISASLYPHRLSRSRCLEPPKSLNHLLFFCKTQILNIPCKQAVYPSAATAGRPGAVIKYRDVSLAGRRGGGGGPANQRARQARLRGKRRR
ncbi:hypothetical protein PR048_030845 [Dryococelus australis]|uniref:Uncharacterized protein n=1 Tax=Dryococelus australis TaxID=614101 RepID=A0ABQ9GA35_9NEOP|nr:hypothetical protein PR048_030845 [Dryococelus australis]